MFHNLPAIGVSKSPDPPAPGPSPRSDDGHGHVEEESITLFGNVLTRASQLEGGVHYAPDGAHTNHFIIKFRQHFDGPQYDQLTQLQVELQHIISSNYWFCRYAPHDLTPVRNLPFVDFINAYHPFYVIDWNDLKSGKAEEPEEYDVCVTVHADYENREATQALGQKIASALGISQAFIFCKSTGILMRMKPHELNVVAEMEEVMVISEDGEDIAFNLVARVDLGVQDQFPPAFSAWLSQENYTCKDTLVAVADQGIDVNNPAFQFNSSRGVRTRIRAVSWRRDGSVNDVTAHGTHVAASVAGNLHSLGFGKDIKGTALGARILFQTVFEKNRTPVKLDFTDLIDQAQGEGAKVHNNSYGRAPKKTGSPKN